MVRFEIFFRLTITLRVICFHYFDLFFILHYDENLEFKKKYNLMFCFSNRNLKNYHKPKHTLIKSRQKRFKQYIDEGWSEWTTILVIKSVCVCI